MLHLFLASMDAGHFWSVIAVQMQHLVVLANGLMTCGTLSATCPFHTKTMQLQHTLTARMWVWASSHGTWQVSVTCLNLSVET